MASTGSAVNGVRMRPGSGFGADDDSDNQQRFEPWQQTVARAAQSGWPLRSSVPGRSAMLMQPCGRHMPCDNSLGTAERRAWQMGPVMPGLRPMCDSAGSGHVSAAQPGILRHAKSASWRSSVHCLPNGGGSMQP